MQVNSLDPNNEEFSADLLQANIESSVQPSDTAQQVVAAMGRLLQSQAIEQVADRIANDYSKAPVVYCQVAGGDGGLATLEIDLAAVFGTYGPEHAPGLAGSFSAWLREHARNEGMKALQRANDVIVAKIEEAAPPAEEEPIIDAAYLEDPS